MYFCNSWSILEAFLFVTLRSHFNEGKSHNHAILVLLKLLWSILIQPDSWLKSCPVNYKGVHKGSMLHTGHISQNELRGHRLLLIRPCSTEVSVIRADAFRDTELETDMKGDTDWLCWGDFVLGLSKGDITPFCYRNNLWPHAALRVEKSLPSAGLLDVQCGTVQRLYETNTPLQQQERIPSSLSLFLWGHLYSFTAVVLIWATTQDTAVHWQPL